NSRKTPKTNHNKTIIEQKIDQTAISPVSSNVHRNKLCNQIFHTEESVQPTDFYQIILYHHPVSTFSEMMTKNWQ
ncbi:hypothetical protein KDV52_20945, partial [Providencia rettgeri]